MGVKGLWTLLTPVGRPVMLETVEGKTMAIDSSIWLYQFQATMRDKEGRGLVNAHVLGFLRRISKLLFYGIKPVFVFDGGAPALKRSTLNERRKKKSGAATSHVKLAERLLAAQMRREALNHAKKQASGPKDTDLNDDTVYLEDLEGTAPKTPRKRNPPSNPSSSTKKKTFDHDPYNLPQVDMDEAISKATRSAAPDPRLATEDELRVFIEQMKPEDFDINSPAFRELPTEVQYEIVGDLRLKSRQTSHARLHKMLKNARTPMDFSKQQIENLRQRNTLTQQLLTTTDTIGSAHIAIPVRIASERNKEYVLIKNEGVDGGWILGIKDTGTREKPIVLDHEQDEAKPVVNADEDSDDDDMEEVEVPSLPTPDADLREYQRGNALAGISGRNSSTGLRPLTTRPIRPIDRKDKSKRSFNLAEAIDNSFTESTATSALAEDVDEDEDDMMAYAIQASLDQANQSPFSPFGTPQRKTPLASTSSHAQPREEHVISDDDDDIYVDFAPRTSMESALALANASPSARRTPSGLTSQSAGNSSMFGQSMLLANPKTPTRPSISASNSLFGTSSLLDSSSRKAAVDTVTPISVDEGSDSDDDMELVASAPQDSVPVKSTSPEGKPGLDQEAETSTISSESFTPIGGRLHPPPALQPAKSSSDGLQNAPSNDTQRVVVQSQAADVEVLSDESDEDMEEIAVPEVRAVRISTPPQQDDTMEEPEQSDDDMEEVPVGDGVDSPKPILEPESPRPQPIATALSSGDTEIVERDITPDTPPRPSTPPRSRSTTTFNNEPLFTMSRSPSPSLSMDMEASRPGSPNQQTMDEWDAADEMDVHAEEGDFAQFMSQVKGKNVEEIRKEIDAEIQDLNQQRKAAMRDSEDITQQMISQIMAMLRLFGIPYITAPMEAEAQCAELVELGLVDGVITDDSDVFLFGAQRVYKNMFNQSKTVECFLSTDLSRELGLDRDTLVQLAYLLGSDYTEGLPGVGPVVAMELLKEFPGRNGLFKFRTWWEKVQSGKDKDEDNKSTFRKRFKKRFKELYLASDWPNSVVRDAYYHPTVDKSEEPFKWGIPDLSGLREFFHQELGWGQAKVDELLLPIIQKMNKRSQAAALNKQGNLNDFLDLSAGSGTHAPRQRNAYASKRLQQVISDFRKRNRSASATPGPAGPDALENENGAASSTSGDADEVESNGDSQPAKRRKTQAKGKAKPKAMPVGGASTRGKTTTRGRGRGGRAGRGAKGKGKARADQDSADEQEDGSEDEDTYVPERATDMPTDQPVPEPNLRPRPKPRPRRRIPEVDAEMQGGESEPYLAQDGASASS